ncbi:MAG: aldo/keto reductase [Chloroflexota bacterium]|nr:aldo/keto reductase [Chloroflexota bacterium]
MKYNRLGRTGLDVSVIGLGTEHLEQTKENMEEVFRVAVEAGVNYIDVLYSNPEADAAFWDSIGPELRHYRERLVLTAHWGPSDMYRDPAECQRHLERALERVANDYFEVVMLTVVDSEETWNGWAQESLARLLPYKERGHVGHIGVSGHMASVALKVVKSGVVDVLMYPINLLGHDDEGIKALYHACREQDVGLVAMKPYHGGTLLVASGEPSGITPAQCLHYVISQPVSTTVPGAKNASELRATLHYLEAADEEKDYSSLPANLHEYLEGQCVYCHHCLPCPQDIQVGWIIWLVDQARDGVTDELAGWYSSHQVQASSCVECGDCVERCPFKVDIISKMRQAVDLFES